MFHEIFRTKERKVIAAILGVIILIIGIIVFKNIADGELFVEKAVMAENYLETGDYEKAVEAYIQALSVKDSDVESLSIGLSDAYIGLNDYDTALEVLNSCYQKTSGEEIKKKIEEVMSAKTDYEYLQSISRAEVYYSNKEYDKAIAEFEQAKLIDSKKVTAYQRIAEAYVELGKYDLAREEVLEGQEVTQDKSLEDTLALVDSYLKKAQYDTIVAQAEEYIYQENFKDGIKTYKEAAILLPQESAAYMGLAKAYISMDDYEDAMITLQDALELKQNSELSSLLAEVTQHMSDEEERKKILSELYSAMRARNIESVSTTMKLDFFLEKIAPETPIYYGVDKEDMSLGAGMAIYDSQTIYFGEFRNGLRNGNGFFVVMPESEEEAGYYYYEGNWNLDLPQGSGKTVEMKILENDSGKSYESKVVTEGAFMNGAENGTMIKYFYSNDEETGRLTYTARNGVPVPEKYSGSLQSILQKKNPYSLGEILLDGESIGEEYQVEPNTLWGVKTFISDNE